MFMLVGEFSGFFGTLVNPSMDGTIIASIGRQLEHADWIGLHFWDLIQPFFMFIVGVAMPFSMTRLVALLATDPVGIPEAETA